MKTANIFRKSLALVSAALMTLTLAACSSQAPAATAAPAAESAETPVRIRTRRSVMQRHDGDSWRIAPVVCLHTFNLNSLTIKLKAFLKRHNTHH